VFTFLEMLFGFVVAFFEVDFNGDHLYKFE
jgi:hypothetical protein